MNLFHRFKLEMILLAECLHADFYLTKVEFVLIVFFSSFIHVGEIIDHQLCISDAITLPTLPLILDCPDFFESVVTCLLLNPSTFSILLVSPFQVQRSD